MKISELSKWVSCPVQTIRYYEQQGLLAPAGRTPGNYRVYSDADVARLRFIRHCRNLDLSLDEIRQLLKLYDRPHESCDAVNELVDEHIAKAARRIAELQALETHFRDLRELCNRGKTTRECAILRELAESPRSDNNGTSLVQQEPHVMRDGLHRPL